MRINGERLKKTITDMAQIGATPNGGVTRLALSDEDKDARDLLKRWMIETGLEIRIDDFGNLYGRRPGTDPEAGAILIGSHLDSVPAGGRFDGVVGVLASLEVLRTFKDLGIQTKRPVEMVNFTGEEGARFSPPMLGSGGITQMFSSSFIYDRVDADGVRFEDELIRIGYRGESPHRAKNVQHFVELHIEQGPILDTECVPIGAVEGIVGVSWLEVTVRGVRGHAGSTPMAMRRDALIAASVMVSAIAEVATQADKDLLLTVGKFVPRSSAPNVIPDEVTFSVDIRHYDSLIRKRGVQAVKDLLMSIGKEKGVDVSVVDLWNMEPTVFSKSLVELICEVSSFLGYPVRKIRGGIGHDAKYMNEICPSAMIFIPCVEGKSHCEDELASWEDIEKGANVLLHVVYRLAQQ
ncbi:Zn-dependent hydrolase [Kyrpidia sp.]|uniref:Zn-dependent hydrolase n=1 Tax=Kyrpidia sp. TaxID=2073077 RepID=UPI00258F04CF|nr:Zn-dependent hydrolase [Kyrpidia sp.]MCL6575057.1 Zn-dependent hydrolase [Kyrpidia sp.]